MCPLTAPIHPHYETACIMLFNRNNPQKMENPVYSRSVHKGGRRRQGLRMKGQFIKTTRKYSGLLSAAPGTERNRLTQPHRRINWDMNSASVSLFSTRDKREREKGSRKKQQEGSSLLLLSSQLLMYSLLSRGEEHSSHAHFSLKLPV